MIRAALLVLLAGLSGCAAYEARNRILVCFGFCTLQGVQVIRDPEGDLVVAPPEESKE
jgi:hypothetical protein